ncbi:RNA methyltransferase [Methanobrevibacter filiformis]|uniref:tRNA (cytidine(56)-2'-O)-methyltransferase n=1 Tax=Methanobrevibacter filiformis TaxID=55758 RepID=A0A165YUK0_9EURY|nr:tRNA (cytidine(56)-2'-O)-methyltransferase [Methanobrevibacter filiformis]KZX09886.1 tRNA 2'-O-methylase [Methanobrevibacter filiformis]
MKINVLRLDHRFVRDTRITTHVCLTARAFGASKVYLSGDKDNKLIENVQDTSNRWGGSFEIEYKKNPMNLIDQWKNEGGEVIHLTMYGSQVPKVIDEIKASNKDKLIVVGGSKVQIEVYKNATWNVSITSQPHSEVSSLGVFQHMLMDGSEFDLKFENPVLEVVPLAHGKTVNINNENKKN